MITLKTLPQASAQKIFDQVAAHLLSQKKKSIAPDTTNSCMYRNPEGLKCAAGCLIGNDEYHENMEGLPWSYLIKSFSIPENHAGLISELQEVHDWNTVEGWEAGLKRVAIRNNLKFNFEKDNVPG